MRLTKRAQFPLTNKTMSLCSKWDRASFSSWPVCLASAAASFRISATASSCHPPRDSTAKGINFIPWCRQSSKAPLFFLVTATSRAWPGLAYAPVTVAALRWCITVTSQVVSRPPVQCGTKTSAGLRSSSGSLNHPSLEGPRDGATAVL